MRRETLFAVALAALMVLGGCIGGGGQPDDGSDGQNGMSAADIREQSLSAMKEVDTAEYEMSVDAETGNGNVDMDIEGAMDRAAKKQRMDMRIQMDVQGRSQSVDATAYVEGETMYMNVQDRWVTRDMSDRNMWERGGQIGSSRAMLEAVTVTKDGTATVAGTDTYVLQLEADDMEKFREALSEQMSQGSQNAGSIAAGDVESFDATMYIAKDTMHIRKMELDMKMNAQGQTVDMTMTVTYTSVGEDVSITIPDEAKGRLRAPAGAPA